MNGRLAAAGLGALAAGSVALVGCGRLPEPPPAALARAAAARTAAGPVTGLAGGAGDLSGGVAEAVSWTGRLPSGALALPAPEARPVRVRVAALDVDSPVVAAAVAGDGRLELPADTTTVAWFVGGAVPGDSGSAVLAAHVDFGGTRGAFFELAQLPVGSEIDVVFADGRTRTFRTNADAEAHVKAELPVEWLFRRGGEASLTLVTCGGAFDPVARAYAENTLVTATPA